MDRILHALFHDDAEDISLHQMIWALAAGWLLCLPLVVAAQGLWFGWW